MESYRSAQVLRSSADEGLRAYMLRVYNYMFVALGLTALVSWVVFQISVVGSADGRIVQVTQIGAFLLSPVVNLVLALGLMGLLFYINMNLARLSVRRAQQLFFVYAALMGITLAPVVLVYTGASIARAFLISSVSFGALSLYGYTTKRDLSAWGTFLFMGLLGVVLASVANIFIHSSSLQLAVSIAGILVFAGLTAWDTQSIKSMYYMGGNYGATGEKKAIFGATRLYLDFINMFLFFLSLSGDRR